MAVRQWRIDLDDAHRLVAELAAVRSRVDELAADAARLDRPLHLGDNWVGRHMAHRLRGVATAEHGMAPTLRTLRQVLDDLEATVRLAAGHYRDTEDGVVADLAAAR